MTIATKIRSLLQRQPAVSTAIWGKPAGRESQAHQYARNTNHLRAFGYMADPDYFYIEALANMVVNFSETSDGPQLIGFRDGSIVRVFDHLSITQDMWVVASSERDDMV